MGLERVNPDRAVLASPSGGSMRPTPQEALRIFWSLGIKKQADILHQFAMMSRGGNGPWIVGGYPRIRVRQHYYPDWSDEDFQWVIDQINSGS